MVACGLQPGSVTPFQTFQPTSHTEIIPSPQADATTYPFTTVSQENLPTPTPTLYTVVLNDTLIGIARKFKVNLEELLTANPKAANGPLLVGMTLTIPAGQGSTGPSTPTPVPVEIQQVNCFKNQDQTWWCLALVRNNSEFAIQNISAQIFLTQVGTQSDPQTVFSPLDILPPGKSVALGVLFPANTSNKIIPAIQVLTASSLESPLGAYPLVQVDRLLVQVDWKGSNAKVSGQVRLTDPNARAGEIRLLGMAFDKNGNLVGFKLWDSTVELNGGNSLPFEINVSSLAGSIDHVELLAEAEK